MSDQLGSYKLMVIGIMIYRKEEGDCCLSRDLQNTWRSLVQHLTHTLQILRERLVTLGVFGNLMMPLLLITAPCLTSHVKLCRW